MGSWLKRLGELRRGLLVIAAILLLVAIALPMWQITLGAPQYPPPEGPLEVEMYVYPRLAGDYEEVNRLNAYVGFYYPDPVWTDPDFPVHEHSINTPEWTLAPWVFVILAALCLFVAIAPSVRKLKLGLVSLLVGTSVVFVGSLILIQVRLYQAGHNLDPNAPMDIEGFTPPVLGSYEVANISGFAWVGPGAYLTVVAVGLMLIAVFMRHRDTTFADLVRGIGGWFSRGSSGEDADSNGKKSGNGAAANSQMVFSAATLGMVAAVGAAPLVMPATVQPTGPDYVDALQSSQIELQQVAPTPQATVGDEQFDSAADAIAAADPGDTVVLEGTFDERLVVDTADVTVTAGDAAAVIDGGSEGRVVTVAAEGITVHGLQIRNSGYDLGAEDAGLFVGEDAHRARLTDLTLTDIAFGVWVDGAHEVTISRCQIRGRLDLFPMVRRGNGIQLWNADDAVIKDNRIVGVRDGIYFSWAEGVDAIGNQLRDSRYGVHYMYSSDNRLIDNVAVDNDVGYALMVSRRLEITGNTAARNSGASGHGILVKDIDDSVINNNRVIENTNGFYIYNSQDNQIESNLMAGNQVGIHYTAGSEGQTVVSNSFIDNDQAATITGRQFKTWNGNYWSDARTIDLNHDGTSEIRHRPAGLVEHLVDRLPVAAVFANSPAFDVVRLAESSFPVIEAPGIVDENPLVDSPHFQKRSKKADRGSAR